MDTSSLTGKVVVITGSSAGLGRAIALEFAKYNTKLALLSRNEQRLQSLLDEISQSGSQAIAIPIDIADAKQVEIATQQIIQQYSSIEIWINNAMTSVFAESWNIKPDEFKRVTEVTYLGYVYGTLSALTYMREKNNGVIIQVGSALAYRSIPLQSAYSAAKHAIQGFTESVRTELLHEKSNIHITMVQMPGLNTPQFDWVRSRLSNKPQPVPPIYQPEVGAQAVLWSAVNKRRELNVGFSTDIAIWGNKFFPHFLDDQLAKIGYQNQMTDEPANPNRPDNLFETVPGAYGSHGSFDDQAKTENFQFWVATHLGAHYFAIIIWTGVFLVLINLILLISILF